MKFNNNRVKIMATAASITGTHRSSECHFLLALDTITMRTKCPIKVPMVTQAGKRIVACAAVITPFEYKVAAVAQPAAFGFNDR